MVWLYHCSSRTSSEDYGHNKNTVFHLFIVGIYLRVSSFHRIIFVCLGSCVKEERLYIYSV